MKPPKWVDSLTCSISVPLPVLSDLLCLRAGRTGVQWFEIVSCHISSESTYSRLEREKWYDSRSQSLSIIEAKVVSIWKESSFIQSIFYAPTPKPTSKENKKSGKSEYASSWRLAQSTFQGDSISYSRDLVDAPSHLLYHDQMWGCIGPWLTHVKYVVHQTRLRPRPRQKHPVKQVRWCKRIMIRITYSRTRNSQ